MSEMYGFKHDLLDCRPDSSITYLADCDNADWEPADERWKDTFLMKLMHLHEDSYGQCYIVFPPLYWKQDEDADHMYYDCRISNEEFPGSTCVLTGESNIFSIIDNTMLNIIGVMVYKRLDWKEFLRKNPHNWKTVKLEKGNGNE